MQAYARNSKKYTLRAPRSPFGLVRSQEFLWGKILRVSCLRALRAEQESENKSLTVQAAAVQLSGQQNLKSAVRKRMISEVKTKILKQCDLKTLFNPMLLLSSIISRYLARSITYSSWSRIKCFWSSARRFLKNIDHILHLHFIHLRPFQLSGLGSSAHHHPITPRRGTRSYY